MTCIGVLHHIPNVTTVVKEIYRCLINDGYALVREPIVSMGDWSKPRQGLTKRERGIPVEIFRNIIKDTGFKVKRETFCCFPIIPIIYKLIRKSAYNSDVATWADARLSSLFKWNIRYHPTKVIHKFRPTSIYFILTKE
ncbi:hypothetical protein KBT16_11545 [Nostoc sp. CCCryo 231-06]|nr:hypothetical protein [Nostoc sp. CCCryo 231-06]